jgi:hypothetical protein
LSGNSLFVLGLFHLLGLFGQRSENLLSFAPKPHRVAGSGDHGREQARPTEFTAGGREDGHKSTSKTAPLALQRNAGGKALVNREAPVWF